jgi:transposase InsO family protein
MSGYRQLTQGQRYQMEALLKAGHNQTMIATILSIHKSTVSRELRRNQGLRGYRPKQAHVKAMQRRYEKPKTHIPLTTWVNGPEFISVTRADWAEKHDIQFEFIKPGKPTQNSYVEWFNRTYRTEVLNMYAFKRLSEVREITDN